MSCHAPASSRRTALDHRRLHAGIALRRARLAELCAEFVAACEAEASRHDAPTCSDETAWDDAMWDRYLDRAVALEPSLGAEMRRLQLAIERLERLATLEALPYHPLPCRQPTPTHAAPR